MKNFAQYLTESQKTYKFTIRVAGELPEEFSNTLETALNKFEVLNLGPAKKTPIQEKPLDFPQLQNMEVHHFETEVRYPTTSHMLERYIVDNCGIKHSHVIVRGDNDPIERDQQPQEDKPYESILTTEDMGGESAQDQAGDNRVMDLLKELEKARAEREIDPTESVKPGESKDIGDTENTKSPIGS